MVKFDVIVEFDNDYYSYCLQDDWKMKQHFEFVELETIDETIDEKFDDDDDGDDNYKQLVGVALMLALNCKTRYSTLFRTTTIRQLFNLCVTT